MKGTIIIYILSISSLYADNTEYPAEDYYDVIEYWITDSIAYRIKTFSLDQDIHVQTFKVNNVIEGIEIAESTTPGSYEDIIQRVVKIDFKGTESLKQIEKVFHKHELKGKIEMKDFIFWNPDGRKYRTNSEPK